MHKTTTHPTTMREAMTPTPMTIGSEQKLSLAHRMMREHKLRHLPVLRGGKLVGVLTERDLYFLESMPGVDADIDVVADAMTPDVYVASPDATVAAVARRMAAHKYGCTVVVESGRVAGVFTVTDALQHLVHVLG